MTKARDLADGVINTSELADGSITTAKIADGDITDAKLATGITASKLTGALPAISGAALTGISAGLPGPRGEVFTSSGTFTVPAGVTACKVTVVGGGGGGGKAFGTVSASAGGAGGGTAIKWITGLTSGSTVSVTIGAGGAGSRGTTAVTATAGGTSSFGSYCSATGGAGAANSTSNDNAVVDTLNIGGVGTGGDLNINGGTGSWGRVILHFMNTSGTIVTRDWAIGGSGGAPMGRSGVFGQYDTNNPIPYYPDFEAPVRTYGPFGGYGGGGVDGLDSYSSFGYIAEDATGYGCGGAGGSTGSGIDVGGGNGYQGIVIVEY